MSKLLLLAPLLIVIALAGAACNSGPQNSVTAAPGHGAVAIQIVPNPIVATRVSGDTYDFPFEVVVRETGGRPIRVTRVSADIFGPAGIGLGGESWDAARIESMGYSTSVNPHGELRYRFAPRKSVPDERLFGSVEARLTVEAVDDTGTGTTASTRVTITR
jgi:hypothetical protein